MSIKIDLKNRPAPPFDFPYECFEASLRIQAALDAFTQADPWETKDPLMRRLALRALGAAVASAKTDLGVSSESYIRAMQQILGEDYNTWRQDHEAWSLWPETSWLTSESEDISESDLTAVRTRLIDFTHKIDKLGLFFLRMMQARGQVLPREIKLQVSPPPAPGSDWMGKL